MSLGRKIRVLIWLAAGIGGGVSIQLQSHLGWWGWPLCILGGAILGLVVGIGGSEKTRPSEKEELQAGTTADD